MYGALENFYMLAVTSQFLSPVSTVFDRNTWDHSHPPTFGEDTEKKKKTLYF